MLAKLNMVTVNSQLTVQHEAEYMHGQMKLSTPLTANLHWIATARNLWLVVFISFLPKSESHCEIPLKFLSLKGDRHVCAMHVPRFTMGTAAKRKHFFPFAGQNAWVTIGRESSCQSRREYMKFWGLGQKINHIEVSAGTVIDTHKVSNFSTQ